MEIYCVHDCGAGNADWSCDLQEFVSQCDVVTVNCPLHEGTKGLVNAELLKSFKDHAWLVNTARGAICDNDAVAAAVKSGKLNGMFTTAFMAGLISSETLHSYQATLVMSGTCSPLPATTPGAR